MESAEIKQAINDVERNKAQVQDTISDLKTNLNALLKEIPTLRSSVLEEKTTDIMSNPLLTTAEFFFVGFYVGKMIKLLKAKNYIA
jgi:chromosome segregation ATPase